MNAMPPTLAGGERQRLAIARAVVNRPEILLADEPTGNVDHEMALRIFRLFVELNRLGTTVLIATHDQDLIARSGRPTLYLERGKLSHRAAQPFQPSLGLGITSSPTWRPSASISTPSAWLRMAAMLSARESSALTLSLRRHPAP